MASKSGLLGHKSLLVAAALLCLPSLSWAQAQNTSDILDGVLGNPTVKPTEVPAIQANLFGTDFTISAGQIETLQGNDPAAANALRGKIAELAVQLKQAVAGLRVATTGTGTMVSGNHAEQFACYLDGIGDDVREIVTSSHAGKRVNRTNGVVDMFSQGSTSGMTLRTTLGHNGKWAFAHAPDECGQGGSEFTPTVLSVDVQNAASHMRSTRFVTAKVVRTTPNATPLWTILVGNTATADTVAAKTWDVQFAVQASGLTRSAAIAQAASLLGKEKLPQNIVDALFGKKTIIAQNGHEEAND